MQDQKPLPHSVEILVVEDTPASLHLLTELLTREGYTVRQAQDGEMGLLSVAARLPDLIMLDVRMPVMDGFEVCRRLKSDARTAGVPVIFLSALQDTEAKVWGFRLGAVDYIAKPYDAEEVLARVRTHLELRTLQLRLGDLVMQQTAKLEAEIEERKQTERDLLASQEKLRELTGHLQDVREEERARIARELHDELGQALTVLRIDLTRLSARLDEPRENLEARLASILEMLDRTSDSARAISESLRPGMLDVLGLSAAIEHHVERFSEATGIVCDLQIDQGDFDVGDRVAIAAFRTVQEALTNVARHAEARSVRIHLSALEQELVVVVQDKGRGMPASPTGKERRHGLMGMRERARLLGGCVDIESSPGAGTRVKASLPFGKPGAEHD